MKFAEVVFNFTGITFEDRTRSWIQTQLESSADGSSQNLFSTDKNPTQFRYRVSYHMNALCGFTITIKKVALRWREEIDMLDVLAIQKSNACREAMRKLGYLEIQDSISNTTEVLTSLPFKLQATL